MAGNVSLGILENGTIQLKIQSKKREWLLAFQFETKFNRFQNLSFDTGYENVWVLTKSNSDTISYHLDLQWA